jgi:hypothetical protein
MLLHRLDSDDHGQQVCGIRAGFFHELFALMHTIHRLLRLCCYHEETQDDISPGF